MQRQRFIETFFEAIGSGLIPLFKLAVEFPEGGQRLLVRRSVVRSLKPLAPRVLFALRQVVHDILALVPFMPISA